VSGEIEVGGMHWVRDRRDRWISDEDDAALGTEAAMLDEIERLRAAGDALAEVALIAVIHCRDHEVEQCNRAYAAWQEARRER
jgi:hypothetical protein